MSNKIEAGQIYKTNSCDDIRIVEYINNSKAVVECQIKAGASLRTIVCLMTLAVGLRKPLLPM